MKIFNKKTEFYPVVIIMLKILFEERIFFNPWYIEYRKEDIKWAIKRLKIIRKSLEAIYGKFTKKYCNPKKCLSSTWGSTCCSKCAKNKGYYRNYIDHAFAEVMQIKEKYWVDDKHGYLSKKGCNIPAHLRSNVCSNYLCDGILNKIDKKFRMKDFYYNFWHIFKISDRIDEYKKEIVKNKLKLEMIYSFQLLSPALRRMIG